MAATLDAELGANPQAAGNVSGTVVTLTTENAVAAGALIVLSSWEFAATGTPTCTFSGGGLTWASAATGAKRLGAYGSRIGYARAPSGLPAGTVLTATWSASASELYLFGSSFLGADPVLVGNNSIVSGANSTTWTTGAVSPTTDSLMVGVARTDVFSGSTPGAGFTEEPSPPGEFANSFGGITFTSVYKLLAASGVSANPTGTTATTSYEGVTVAFRITGTPVSPSFVSAGTLVATTNNYVSPSSASPGLPTGMTTGKTLMLLFAFFDMGATTSGSIGTPAGWTDLGLDSGAVANSQIAKIFGRIFTTGDTAPSVSFTGGTAGTTGATGLTQILAYDDVDVSAFPGTPGSVLVGSGTALNQTVTSTNINAIPGFTPSANNSRLVVFGGKSSVSAGNPTGFAVLTGESLTWNERVDAGSTNAGDAWMVIDDADVVTATAIAAKTFTATGGTASRAVGRMFALKTRPLVATIGRSPTTLSFNAPAGGANPANKTVSITNTGDAGTTLAWTATDNAAWLSVTASGTAPSTLTASIDTTGLAAGTYTGTITIAATGATNTPQTVGVTLTVVAKMETFTDDFNTTLDTAKWTVVASGAPVTVSGQLQVKAWGSIAEVRSKLLYDLTGSYVLVKATMPTTLVNGDEQSFVVGNNEDWFATWRVNSTTGVVEFSAGGTALPTYDPVAHAWWRWREAGGTIYFDTAPDGVTWTNLYSFSPITGFPVDATTVYFRGFGSTGVQFALYDNLNLPPGGPPAIVRPGRSVVKRQAVNRAAVI